MHRIRLLPPLALLGFSSALGLTFFASSPGATAAATPAVATPAATTPAVTTPASTSTTAGSTTTPPTLSLDASSVQNGQLLFVANCASCHGESASGSSRAPNLVGLGSATIDFWVSSGRMPLATPSAEAEPKQSRFTRPEQLDIVKYVTSLGPGGPGIPSVDLNGADVGQGFSLFSTNCAGCHAVGGVGDALSNGLSAPSLSYATPTQVVEAIQTGPANMPRFSSFQFNAAQINDITAYVTQHIQHPADRGGNGLAHVGPITEGLVALFLGLGSMLGLLYWIGDRN
ncbi:MAG: cytochrome bc1 complex diheme cytochrome c subunit [Acidimicrobiales bacterium]